MMLGEREAEGRTSFLSSFFFCTCWWAMPSTRCPEYERGKRAKVSFFPIDSLTPFLFIILLSMSGYVYTLRLCLTPPSFPHYSLNYLDANRLLVFGMNFSRKHIDTKVPHITAFTYLDLQYLPTYLCIYLVETLLTETSVHWLTSLFVVKYLVLYLLKQLFFSIDCQRT